MSLSNLLNEHHNILHSLPEENTTGLLKQRPLRKISVIGIGEVSCPPDRCTFHVRIQSAKYNLEEVKISVSRRLTYIEQILKESEFKNTSINIFKNLEKKSGEYTLTADVKLVFENLKACEELRNILVEKLQCIAVEVDSMRLYHSPSSTQRLRHTASLIAADCAKNKAKDMAQTMNQHLGNPILIQERKCDEWCGLKLNCHSVQANDSSIQEQIDMATKTIKCEVHAEFELLAKRHNIDSNKLP